MNNRLIRQKVHRLVRFYKSRSQITIPKDDAIPHTIHIVSPSGSQRKRTDFRWLSFLYPFFCCDIATVCTYRRRIPWENQEIWPLSVKENGKLLISYTFKYCARVIHHELGNLLFHSHCLRHTHGTMLAEQGVNPKTIMECLEHKDIKTTLQVYTFNTEVMQQAAVDIFESAIYQERYYPAGI